MNLTGSGEVHNPLGSLKLPRRLDCLPVITESVLDHLISCSHVVTLTGRSYRALLCLDKAIEKKVVTV